MPKTKQAKEKILISLDKELVKRLRNGKIRASIVINGLLWKHYSQIPYPSSFEAHNPEVVGSNPSSATLGVSQMDKNSDYDRQYHL
ncbi:hypothetical protein H6501_01435 [Candidatus Woesearchaeota archaeon]|nr:hypothetical protein [Candidatus Woesearchaeota archaeon]USN44763.1 MAG: hypothetical protein H6500_02885 [Candidatus Woesearchaeota archaeon]